MQHAMRYLLISAAVLVLAGCASRYPEPIRTDVTNLVEFETAQRDTEAAQGGTARWGGVIANVQNTEQQTRLEVVNFRINGYGRPQVSDNSNGRFVVYIDRFVDPEIYKRGRQVTALGQFSGIEEGQIGSFNYNYPVIQAEGVELWQERREVQQAPYWGYYDPHSLMYRNHLYGVGPYRYHPYYYPHQRGRVIEGPRRPPQQIQRNPQRGSPQGVDRPRQQQH